MGFRVVLFMFFILTVPLGAQKAIDASGYQSLLNQYKAKPDPRVLPDLVAYELKHFGSIDPQVLSVHGEALLKGIGTEESPQTKVANRLLLAEWMLRKVDAPAAVDQAQRALDEATALADPALVADSWALLGAAFLDKYDYDQGAQWSQKAFDSPATSPERRALTIFSLYRVFDFKGQFNSGIFLLQKQQAFVDSLGDINYSNKLNYYRGQSSLNIRSYDKAIELFNDLLPKLTRDDTDLYYFSHVLLAVAYTKKELWQKAADVYRQILPTAIAEKVDHQVVNISAGQILVYTEMGDLPRAKEVIDFVLAGYRQLEPTQPYYFDLLYSEIGRYWRKAGDPAQALAFQEKALTIAQSIDDNYVLERVYRELYHSYLAKANFAAALENYVKATELNEKQLNINISNQVSELNIQYETAEKEKHILLLDNEKKLALQANQTLSIILGVAGFALVGFLILTIIIVRSRNQIRKQNVVIEAEREKSDRLLLNILPAKVAEELKTSGTSDPELFEHTTVFFSDIVGFTNISSKIQPKNLINELNEIFTAFDQIMDKHSCSRVKTIGDAYMAVCGMPVENSRHAVNIVAAALDCVEFMKRRNEVSKIQWLVRIGVHSGPVVGGIVGVNKYIYDIFGDTVNTASRMESNSEPLKVNISPSTYEQVKHRFRVEPRPPMIVKGKGELAMYFVEGPVNEV